MAFRLSDDEQMIQTMVGEFAQGQITLDGAQDLDRHDRFPETILQTAAGLGLTSMTLPAEQGGAGITPVAFAAALEQIARVCVSTATLLANHGYALRLLAHGDASAAAGGEIAAVLATEEAHGSDKETLGTEAVPDGDGFVLTGMKVWAIGAAGAKHFVTLARVPGEGPTLFHVPASAEGITLGRNEALMGLRACGIRTVYFSGVRVPKTAILGEVGQGATMLAKERPWLHVGVAAIAVGATLGGYEAAREFAQTRIQFGEPIGKYQAVSDKVTEVATQAAAARALTFQAASHLDDDDAATWAAQAKAFAIEMAIPNTRHNIRIQAGTGFMREGGTERFARDVRSLQFVGEPVHMQKDVIKRAIMPDVPFETAP